MVSMRNRLNQSHAFHSVRLHAVLIIITVLALGFIDLTPYSQAFALAAYAAMIIFVEFAAFHILQLRHRRKHPISAEPTT